MRENQHTPTKEECLADFQEAMSTVVANLYRSGWTAETPNPHHHPTVEFVAAA